LAKIIEIVLQGEVIELTSVIEFTEMACTIADGLGGPPKCTENENDGHLVTVLPMMGPEGHFLRQEEIGNWAGLEVTELYAVYQVAEGAYSSENYPVGEYAIVFIGKPEITNVTLQVRAGKIVRIDHGIGNPPDINEGVVAMYLISPPNLSE
jgi:hypothetical protein